MRTSSTELTFPPLQGSSLIGFLAALGAFRTLATLPETSDVRMRWVPGGGSYCPVLRLPSPADPEVVVEKLHTALHGLAGHYVITADKDLKIPRGVFRNLATKAAEDFLTHTDPNAASMVAAFGCDAVGNEDGTIEDTAFRTMSGAGHQHFLEFMNVLAKETTAEQLREALFGPWRYRDSSPTMRWDAEDDRRYALRWDEPSKDPVRTVRGANLLAIAALPLFPVVPTSGDTVGTTGFSGRGSRDTFITWPIWTGWLGLDAICSLLGFKELQERSETSVRSLKPYGVAATYRSQRITLGKYRNFTPAAPM
ncbi:MAG: hypothetical protein L0Z50_06140 [Verrucomicrobiales bacterium]|nr:hypothetical protein [Verrucomicrobiales bacterium]